MTNQFVTNQCSARLVMEYLKQQKFIEFTHQHCLIWLRRCETFNYFVWNTFKFKSIEVAALIYID